ncbi:hypothetical protein [Rhizobium sp. P28RR-XV]|uniref:hypothetical protein n=1 Tax=Rhizobium sp. P28RR-XV TaxID=2726737 RepID=UPI0014570C23|nr:hypothetical protein [Rhizobium sp. P28RR-XV]NLR86250.1 hypothetical protein [Rhizobium sp. P28RR-XV]
MCLLAMAAVLSPFRVGAASAQVSLHQGSEAANLTEFQSFWAHFRQAVMNDDIAAIEALTVFPLKTKGQLDDDPVKAIGKRAFAPLLRSRLKEDANMRGFSGNTLDFLRANPVFPRIDVDGSGDQNVGSLVFRRQTNGWKLSMIYRADD